MSVTPVSVPVSHRAAGRPSGTVPPAAAVLAWAWAHVRSVLRAVTCALGRALCWLLCTSWGTAVCIVALPTLTAVAVWLAWPDPASRDSDMPPRMAEQGDVRPCRTSTGGVCAQPAGPVHLPVTGPIAR